ncbi:MAG: hypothetical protein EA374_06240, partial [Acholeplasmatales bacterium]
SEILKEIIKTNVYENDYNEGTSKFIYKVVEYTVAIKSLVEIIDSNIIPSHIEAYKVEFSQDQDW